MSNVTRYNVNYGLSQPLNLEQPLPVIAKRDPNGADKFPIGQEWVNTVTNAVFFLTSVANNVANWVNVAGGALLLTSLTVNPGPTNLSTVGNGAVSIGNATNTGAVTITAGTGNVSIVGAAHTIGIGNDAAANTVVFGSTTGAASTTIQGGTAGVAVNTAVTGTISLGLATMTGAITIGQSTAGQNIVVGTTAATFGNSTQINGGDGGIILNAPEPTGAFAGYISVATTKPTAASPTATITRNSRAMVAIFTGFTTAAAGSQVFTIVSSRILINSTILVSVSNLNASTNGALMQVQGITQSVGSIAVTTKNVSGAALGAGDNVLVSVWILD